MRLSEIRVLHSSTGRRAGHRRPRRARVAAIQAASQESDGKWADDHILNICVNFQDLRGECAALEVQKCLLYYCDYYYFIKHARSN